MPQQLRWTLSVCRTACRKKDFVVKFRCELQLTGVNNPEYATCSAAIHMKILGLRHSSEQVGGLVFFGRMLDKARLHAQGSLPTDYKRGTGTDSRVCRFLGVEYSAVIEKALAGVKDEEILNWCFAHGRKPNEEEIIMFNAFLSKRGWRDNQTEELEQMKRSRGFTHRTDIQTFFDFHKADEAED
jgi:hypothetical protein